MNTTAISAGGCMIIDFHAHAFPDKIAETSIKKISDVSGGVRYYNSGTVNALAFSMADAGIDKSVVLNIATRPGQEQSILKFCRLLQRDSRFIPFFSVHPDSEDAVRYIELAAESGIKGIKIHPYYQNTSLDDSRFEKIIRSASDNGLVILTHAGFDPAYERDRVADAEKILKIKKKLPDLKIIAAHFGGWEDWENASILSQNGIWVDTSFMMHYFPPEKAAEMILAHGKDFVLFGTDTPWTEQKEELEKIKSLPLKNDTVRDITGGNALRLIEI